MKPYKDIEVTDSYIIREFSENIDPIELLWHRVIKGTGTLMLKIHKS